MKVFTFLIFGLLSSMAVAETVNCDVYVKRPYTDWTKFDSYSYNLTSGNYLLVWKEDIAATMENRYFVGIEKNQLVLNSVRMDSIRNKFIKSNPLSCLTTPANKASCEDDWVKLRCTK